MSLQELERQLAIVSEECQKRGESDGARIAEGDVALRLARERVASLEQDLAHADEVPASRQPS